MRGIPFTLEMQTPERLNRFKLYTFRAAYLELWNDANRGLPRIGTQVADRSHYEVALHALKQLAATTCGQQAWDENFALGFHENTKQEERDGFISWIHRSDKTRFAYANWRNKLLNGESVDWLHIDQVAQREALLASNAARAAQVPVEVQNPAFDPSGPFNSVEEAMDAILSQPEPFVVLRAVILSSLNAQETQFALELISAWDKTATQKFTSDEVFFNPSRIQLLIAMMGGSAPLPSNTHTVSFDVLVEADSPEDAAAIALSTLRDPDLNAVSAKVLSSDGFRTINDVTCGAEVVYERSRS